MDRWIGYAWRAFWIGLGASAVLVVQAVVPAAPKSLPSTPDVAASPAGEGMKMGPLARPLRTTTPVEIPSVSQAKHKTTKPGA